MRIDLLDADDLTGHEQAAALLVAGFAAHWPDAWPTLPDALEEVHEALQPGKVCLAARGDDNAVLGWIGGIAQYDGRVWELHPLVVRPDAQGQGVGRALVAALEEHVREHGGLTIILGSDDEASMTTLSDVDLYPDIWAHVQAVRNLRRHPYTFYQKCGFVISGVVPDANGWGKPDILMAKRVAGAPAAPATD